MVTIKQLVWVGSARSDLKALPPEVQDEMGYGLYQAQLGQFPNYAKPLKGFSGVYEIVSDFDKNTYRAMYAAKIDSRIYVLHVFQKKSKSGIKTPKQEIDLIKRRLQVAKIISKGENEHAKKSC
jgi:phage-related protein